MWSGYAPSSTIHRRLARRAKAPMLLAAAFLAARAVSGEPLAVPPELQDELLIASAIVENITAMQIASLPALEMCDAKCIDRLLTGGLRELNEGAMSSREIDWVTRHARESLAIYQLNRVYLSPSFAQKEPANRIAIFAHELAHHLFRRFVPKDAAENNTILNEGFAYFVYHIAAEEMGWRYLRPAFFDYDWEAVSRLGHRAYMEELPTLINYLAHETGYSFFLQEYQRHGPSGIRAQFEAGLPDSLELLRIHFRVPARDQAAVNPVMHRFRSAIPCKSQASDVDASVFVPVVRLLSGFKLLISGWRGGFLIDFECPEMGTLMVFGGKFDTPELAKQFKNASHALTKMQLQRDDRFLGEDTDVGCISGRFWDAGKGDLPIIEVSFVEDSWALVVSYENRNPRCNDAVFTTISDWALQVFSGKPGDRHIPIPMLPSM